MQKTKIEWTQYVWNPIKGICPVDCKLPDGRSYCYGRAIYNRFDWMQEDMGEIGYLAEWELEQPIKRKKPTKIFVCSTYELFHSPDKFARDEIFKIIEKCPQHIFQILTKFPQNIDRPMPDNVWLGCTITDMRDYLKVPYFEIVKARIKFLSFEPMLYDGEYPLPESWGELVDWIIVGKLTGFGKEYNPHKEQIAKFIRFGERFSIPIFLKNNLKKIWEEPLIQERMNMMRYIIEGGKEMKGYKPPPKKSKRPNKPTPTPLRIMKCQHKKTVALNEEGNAGVYCPNCGEKLEDAC